MRGKPCRPGERYPSLWTYWKQGGGFYCQHCDQHLEGSWVRISLTDEGKGIKEKWNKKIYNPFSTTKAGKQGLGLAQVSGILTHYGGHIIHRSKPGEGTEMTVLLPFPE